MHEYSIVSSLVDRVQREVAVYGADSVRRLHVRIGELSGVELDLLQTAFDTFRERTVCQGAELVIHPVAAEWKCTSCDRTVVRGSVLRCDTCGRPARLSRGDEIILDRIEMEVSDV